MSRLLILLPHVILIDLYDFSNWDKYCKVCINLGNLEINKII